MSDSAYQVFQRYGTNAERGAFTPDPPASPAGTQPLYCWRETDTGDVYLYDTGWHLLIAGVAVFTLLTADPGSPANDTWWVVRSGTSPTMTVALKARIAGVTQTIASITL